MQHEGIGTHFLQSLYQGLLDHLAAWGLHGVPATLLASLIALVALAIASAIIYYVARAIILRGFSMIARRTATLWDDKILARRVFHHLTNLAPGALWLYVVPRLFPDSLHTLTRVVHVLTVLYMIFVTLRAINAFLNAAHDIYLLHPVSKTRTIKPYIQVAQIILYLVGGLVMVAVLIDRNPLSLFLGLGAMAAVLMLVFKDAILGLVASIQASANGIVKPGDWISMPSRQTDGVVLEITLTTVKVQNWDRTISTFPTYALISESIANWKGMSESTGRRIRTAIPIDARTVRHADPTEIRHPDAHALLEEYLRTPPRQPEGTTHPHTNLGLFRQFALAYLRAHPLISPEGTCLVRLLPATSKGIPLEIYCFCRIKEWEPFEAVQSQIVEHLYSALQDFHLRAHQDISGATPQ